MLLFAVLLGHAQSGCPGCAIDQSCTGTGPTLCPATLPDGTVGVPYDENLTFFVPQNFTFSGINVTILSIVINTIGGAPPGLSWQSDSPNNTYTVTSSAGTRGCVKICGIPQLPGSYLVTVTVTATVNTPLGQQVQQQQFSLPMVINAPAQGCFLFAAKPNGDGCGAVCDTFTALFEAQVPYSSSYAWTFGNGNTSTQKNPPVQCYNAPGDYPVQLTVTNWKFVIDSVRAQSSGTWWCGDIEEPNLFGACTGSPDMILTMASGNNSKTSSEFTDNSTAFWTNLDFTLDNFSLALSFIDNDNVSNDDNGGAASITINGPGVYTFSTTAPPPATNGGISGTVWVHLEVDTTFTCSDTVVVTPLPPLVALTAIPDSVVCSRDSIVISAYTGPYAYTWFQNDTTLIPFQTNSSYTFQANSFLLQDTTLRLSVLIRDTTTGCTRKIDGIYRMKPDVPPNFATQGIFVPISTPNLIRTLTKPGYTYQWYYNGIPIAGEDTTFYAPTVNGPYYCIYTTPLGCSDTSNTINFIYQDINELNDLSTLLQLYPNPAADIVNIILNMASAHEARLNIIDLSGRVLMEKVISGDAVSVDISTLPGGQYLLSVSGSGFIARKKLVVIH